LKTFEELSEREVLALAISLEEEDARIYEDFAAGLQDRYPEQAQKFREMRREEDGHRHRLIEMYRQRFGEHIPLMRRQDVKGFVDRKPVWQLRPLPLDKVQYAKISIANAPSADLPAGKKGGTPRQQAITDLAFIDGKLYIAGLSNEEFASKLRSVEFPFKSADTGASVEIFHTNHNRVETASPVRTFVPFNVGGEPQILAAYTCTPLVAFSVSSLKPGEKIKGKTVAELGSGNQPIDMIVYEKGGKQFLLLSNSARGVMKISTDTLDKQPALTEKVSGTAGLKYETIEALKGVDQLAKLGNANALLLVKDGTSTLKAIELP
jgi:rubrerythrin